MDNVESKEGYLECDPSEPSWHIDDEGRLWAEIRDLDAYLAFLGYTV